MMLEVVLIMMVVLMTIVLVMRIEEVMLVVIMVMTMTRTVFWSVHSQLDNSLGLCTFTYLNLAAIRNNTTRSCNPQYIIITTPGF